VTHIRLGRIGSGGITGGAVALIVLLTGCGQAIPGNTSGRPAGLAADPTPPATTAPAPSPSSSPPPVNPSSGGLGIVLTDADSGLTVVISVGQNLTINLAGSSTLPWSHLSDSDPAVLGTVPGLAPNPQPPGSLSAVFVALTKGTSRLSAVSVPRCLDSAPACLMPDRVFSLLIEVRGGN